MLDAVPDSRNGSAGTADAALAKEIDEASGTVTSSRPPPRDAEGDEQWWHAARAMAGSLPRMGKQSKAAIGDLVVKRAAGDLRPVPTGSALRLAEAVACQAVATAVAAGADMVALGISTMLSTVLLAAANANVEPPEDLADEATGQRDTRTDRAARRDAEGARQPPPPALPRKCWVHVQRQPGPLLRERMRRAEFWGPTTAQREATRVAWDRAEGTQRKRAAETAAMATLEQVGKKRPHRPYAEHGVESDAEGGDAGGLEGPAGGDGAERDVGDDAQGGGGSATAATMPPTSADQQRGPEVARMEPAAALERFDGGRPDRPHAAHYPLGHRPPAGRRADDDGRQRESLAPRRAGERRDVERDAVNGAQGGERAAAAAAPAPAAAPARELDGAHAGPAPGPMTASGGAGGSEGPSPQAQSPTAEERRNAEANAAALQAFNVSTDGLGAPPPVQAFSAGTDGLGAPPPRPAARPPRKRGAHARAISKAKRRR
jgi:hypothetical protein